MEATPRRRSLADAGTATPRRGSTDFNRQASRTGPIEQLRWMPVTTPAGKSIKEQRIRLIDFVRNVDDKVASLVRSHEKGLLDGTSEKVLQAMQELTDIRNFVGEQESYGWVLPNDPGFNNVRRLQTRVDHYRSETKRLENLIRTYKADIDSLRSRVRVCVTAQASQGSAIRDYRKLNYIVHSNLGVPGSDKLKSQPVTPRTASAPGTARSPASGELNESLFDIQHVRRSFKGTADPSPRPSTWRGSHSSSLSPTAPSPDSSERGRSTPRDRAAPRDAAEPPASAPHTSRSSRLRTSLAMAMPLPGGAPAAPATVATARGDAVEQGAAGIAEEQARTAAAGRKRATGAAEQRYLAKISKLQAALQTVRREVRQLRAGCSRHTEKSRKYEDFFLHCMNDVHQGAIRKKGLADAAWACGRKSGWHEFQWENVMEALATSEYALVLLYELVFPQRTCPLRCRAKPRQQEVVLDDSDPASLDPLALLELELGSRELD